MSTTRGLIAGVTAAAIVIAICLITLLGMGLQVTRTLEAEYEIIDMTVGFPKRSLAEYSIFTIAIGETYYTLPAIPTSYVRSYYVGDVIPVVIREYKDGTYDIRINKSELSKS